ncbi:hypothetical protein K474DRAFT_1655266 [Panus rudis PR-1116 ss-1]|nr:hypothetical protein K474DRAFT_1655266 [Panus rudis PR-1116 ss-1]
MKDRIRGRDDHEAAQLDSRPAQKSFVGGSPWMEKRAKPRPYWNQVWDCSRFRDVKRSSCPS